MEKLTLESQITNLLLGGFYQSEGSVSHSSALEGAKSLIEYRKELMDRIGEDGRYIKEVSVEVDSSAFERDLKMFRNRYGIRFRAATSKFTIQEWKENKVLENKFIPLCELEVPKGMKVSRALGRICRAEELEYSSKEIDQIQTDYSKIINTSELAGYLVVSANPYDILTMSEGQNWTSCMAPGREYGTGSLAYAEDNRTLIAFLVSEGELDSLKSNALTPKRWRRMIIQEKDDKEALLLSKGYPFPSEELAFLAAEMAGEKLFKKEGVITSAKSYDDFDKGVSFRRINSGSQIYSDITKGNDIMIYYNKETVVPGEDMLRFRAGEKVMCYECGSSPATEEGIAGLCCLDMLTCEYCLELLHEGEEVYIDSTDEIVCEVCADEYFVYSDEECEMISYDDAIYIESDSSYVSSQYFLDNGNTCPKCEEKYLSEHDCPVEEAKDEERRYKRSVI